MAFGTLGSFPQGQRVFGESPLSALLGLVLFPLLPELPPWAVFWCRFAAGNYDSLSTCGSEFEFSLRLYRAGFLKVSALRASRGVRATRKLYLPSQLRHCLQLTCMRCVKARLPIVLGLLSI